MSTGLIRRNPASSRLPETVTIHVWGPTQVPVFHLSLYGRPQSEREFGQALRRLSLGRLALGSLYKLCEELSAFSLCGSVFTSDTNGYTDRRFHVSVLVPVEYAMRAEELAREIGAYLEG